jgi:hypothetical protein
MLLTLTSQKEIISHLAGDVEYVLVFTSRRRVYLSTSLEYFGDSILSWLKMLKGILFLWISRRLG